MKLSFQTLKMISRNMPFRHFSRVATSDSKKNVLTMAEVREHMNRRLGIEHGYNINPPTRERLLQYTPKLEDLPPRTMQDSFTSAIIPLSTDFDLQVIYANVFGGIRMGKVMEDMDLFAAWICHQHIYTPKIPANIHFPYTLVTVLVDKITISSKIYENAKPTADVRLSGHVSWVGNSTMEVVVWLEQEYGNTFKKLTRALFLMAARNATNTAAAPVNPISPGNEEEIKILSGGEDRKKRRFALQSQSVHDIKPNQYEESVMFDRFQSTLNVNSLALNERILPANSRWMEDSSTKSTLASFPEHRNSHNRVFGGFIIRNAVEISQAAAYMYSKSRPYCICVSDILFLQPVHVDSIIKLNAQVVYTRENYMQIKTIVDIIDPTTNKQSTADIFHVTFASAESVPKVVPRSYQETLWYILGRRKFKYALNLE